MVLQQDDGTATRSPLPGEHSEVEEWAAVEHEMIKHDEGTMRGHIADVDALLVFAGLFSAVLTAFVVESYQMLQVDNEENSMKLLRRISIQLENFTIYPGVPNVTLPVPPLPSLDFVADRTARWINILWFLSLIFGLAAALFGILVKQWIREYMLWNSALANPRDNVAVRQIRLEAWNDWNVPATIASIPALLEMALVLFVCGLVVLLWTLDPVVSTVITTAVAVFLAVASTFTVLPAFFRRCPYKSPTAWAFAVIWDFLTLYIPSRFRALQHRVGYRLYCWGAGQLGLWVTRTSGHQKKLRIGNWKAVAHDWRSRDLAHLWSSLLPGTKHGDTTPLLDDLRLERTGSPVGFDLRDYADLPAWLYDAQHVITELPPLIRALTWMKRASQDMRAQTNVLRCIESLESRFILPHNLGRNEEFASQYFNEDGVRAVSYWYLALDVRRGMARGIGWTSVMDEKKDLAMLKTHMKLYDQDTSMRAYWSTFRGPSPPELPIFAHLLALSSKRLIGTSSNSSIASSSLQAKSVSRLRQYLGVLWYFGHDCDFEMDSVGDCLYDTFAVTVRQEGDTWWQQAVLETALVAGSPKLKKLLDDLEIKPSHNGWTLFPHEVSKIVETLSSTQPGTPGEAGA